MNDLADGHLLYIGARARGDEHTRYDVYPRDTRGAGLGHVVRWKSGQWEAFPPADDNKYVGRTRWEAATKAWPK